MQQRTKEQSGAFVAWPLASALRWRCEEYHCQIKRAFEELASFCRAGEIAAVGVQVGWHPDRPNKHIPDYRPLWDSHLPTNTRPGTAGHCIIPADEWSDLSYVLDGTGWPTSDLKYTSIGHVAFTRVDFDWAKLTMLWMPVIKASATKKPGPKPKKREAIIDRMLSQLGSGELTVDGLRSEKIEVLGVEYGVAPNTADAAREEALSRFQNSRASNSEKR